ncbi:MAG: NAD-dependent epimerase/dehydratase family protein [Phreatobacter sp.]|nr:NAD-dependent epimerase/dehydratase family protein [Phreatobacter sp.]
MRVLVTGAGGFLGRRLVAALLRQGTLPVDGEARPIGELVLTDRGAMAAVAPPATIRVRTEQGDLADPAWCAGLAAGGFDAIFHLAAMLTLDAERDPEAAYATHVAPVHRLVAGPGRPRLVFASSIAVFGGPLPDVVTEAVPPCPQTTYGTHKAMIEFMLADASRHGAVDARSLRLPIVLVRAGAPTPTVSDAVAALVREPLAGRETVCPLLPDTLLPVISAGAVVRALLALHAVPEAALPPGRAVNLPALSVTPAEMVAAVGRQAGPAAAARVRFAPDPALQAIVDGWPRRFISAHAARLGLAPDADFDAIVADHIDPSAEDRVARA